MTDRLDQLVKLFMDVSLNLSELQEKVYRLEKRLVALEGAALSEEETDGPPTPWTYAQGV